MTVVEFGGISYHRINLHDETYFSMVLLKASCASFVNLSTSCRMITRKTNVQCAFIKLEVYSIYISMGTTY